MVWAKLQTKLLRRSEGEINRFAETEHDLVVEIPLVVRIRPIGVEPALAVVVALEFEHVRIAIGIGYVHYPFQTTTPRILLGLYIIRDCNHLE